MSTYLIVVKGIDQHHDTLSDVTEENYSLADTPKRARHLENDVIPRIRVIAEMIKSHGNRFPNDFNTPLSKEYSEDELEEAEWFNQYVPYGMMEIRSIKVYHCEETQIML